MEKDFSSLTRQYDLDWIRVIATLAVFLYHCTMFVNPFPWHIKNNELDSDGILVFSLFVGAWIMPLFFVISGMSVSYALKSRTMSGYVKERFIKLGVPLAFGVLILTPHQIYIERITNGQYDGSFFSFLPHFFDGIYLDIGGSGNFAFFGLHLWYLLVLLVFSLLTLPLFQKVGIKQFKTHHFYILPIFLFLSNIIKTQGLGGWDLIFYLIVFMYGYYFLSSPLFKTALKATIKIHMFIAVVTTIVYIVWFMSGFPKPGTIESWIYFAVRTFSCWSLLLCVFYFADRYLSFSNKFLTYTSEASMPFYVLHQPVIVLIAYFLHDLSWPIYVKLLILAVVSFVIIMLSYHIIIRRFNSLRFLFGMKVQNKVKSDTTFSTFTSK
ncbi:acyltransferase [Bacillus luteolus]|uniref:Acyltransferase n=1 Tax=Litchfieldia luteola TaxID=682179 RepID=A0ABR9QGG1_9BACI|nr:acyltransferase [Cytobacillus luteolus]MBE4907586.1 acyltransferase [Cytobacillus luteolus]MBP1944361.1 peptidoglycan/LPS O-acetylase OafA/YrhL [Cytobacillus luteolus]